MTQEKSFRDQVDLLTDGIKRIGDHAEALKARLTEVRAECGRLADMIFPTNYPIQDEAAYVHAALKRISEEKP